MPEKGSVGKRRTTNCVGRTHDWLVSMATSSGPAEIRDPHKRPMAGKRFEMPGFRPREDHISQMQRFGFLASHFGQNDPIDNCAVDKADWDSFY